MPGDSMVVHSSSAGDNQAQSNSLMTWGKKAAKPSEPSTVGLAPQWSWLYFFKNEMGYKFELVFRLDNKIAIIDLAQLIT